MTSKEIVRRALRQEKPERLPVFMDSLGVSDARGVLGAVSNPLEPGLKQAEDEWGCVWSRTEVNNMGQVTDHPLADISKMDKLSVPNFKKESRFTEAHALVALAESENKYVMASIFMVLFERMHSLHGFENTLADLYADRPAMEELADRIVEAHVTFVRETARRFPGRINGWDMTDDWGTQQNSFVSYKLWMDFFLPRYKRIFDAMHETGADVWLHSCGRINDLIEGYIQAGVNSVNLQQPRALGIEEIGRRYRGRIAFHSLADIQATLPTGDRKKIDADAADLMTHWASPQGGFVFSDYGDGEAIGVNDPTVKPYMYDAFSKWSEKLYGKPLPARKNG